MAWCHSVVAGPAAVNTLVHVLPLIPYGDMHGTMECQSIAYHDMHGGVWNVKAVPMVTWVTVHSVSGATGSR